MSPCVSLTIAGIHLILKVVGREEQCLIQMSYTGKSDIGKYFFRKIQFCDVDKYGRMGLFIDMIFSRPLTGSFMTIFLPTGMLLMISQMSTIFSKSFLDIVIEVNTTLLLVLTT